jgi:large subunit ribosomal protein L10
MAEKRKTGQIPESKKRTVDEFAQLMESYPIIGAVNIENLPAPQLQKMREQLRLKNIVLRMTKRRLIKLAVEKVKAGKKGIEKLEQNFAGMPAVIFTNENPFKLFKFLQKNKSSAPAKAGQTAPFDIKVNAGPTPFAPGPIIGELGSLKIKTGVEGGKVVVKQDSVVVRKGEKVSQKAAEVLARLGIQPMEVGLDLVAVFEDGEIFTRDLLSVDEAEYISNITKAARWSLNLAVEAAYASKDTVKMLLQKGFRDSRAVALEYGVVADGMVGDLLARASMQAMSLKQELGI